MKLIKMDIRKWVLPVAIMICLGVMPFIGMPADGALPGPYFSISILAPNTSLARNQWSTLMVEQLPKIGIEVDIFDHTGWAQIGPRTWSHPGPYPIPTYAEGGFDILFVGYGWGLDFDPTGLFTSDGWTPDGDNFYQYASQEMDNAVGNYTQSFIFSERMEYATDIQEILYEDNPSICLIYKTSLLPHDLEFTGWDPLLWVSSYQPMENFSMGSATDFHYATPGDFVDFHPWLYEATYDAEWLHQIYNGLVERDPLQERSYQPRILEYFNTLDGVTYECKILDSAVWGDGTPIDSDDIIYNFQLGVTQSLGHTTYSFNSLYWDNSSVTKINDKEFTIDFLQPYVFQEVNLAGWLLPEHIWSSISPADHANQAITWAAEEPTKLFGCGPYKLAEWDGTNAILHLEKNTHFVDWFGSEPNFDDIYFETYTNAEGAISALASGAIDMINPEFYIQPDDLDGISGISYTLVDDPGNQEMSINMMHPYLGTGELCPISDPESGKHIRKAISHIVPREVIVEEILGGLGQPGVTHWPSVSIGFDDTIDPYEYSIDLALEHMAAAGFDVPTDTPTPTPTQTSGMGLYIVMSILALAGASQVFLLKKRK